MSKAIFNADDPLLLNDQLNEDERMVRDSAYAYCQEQLAPRIQEAFRHERTARISVTMTRIFIKSEILWSDFLIE